MKRVEARSVGIDVVEDRLSALLALALVVANLAGGGMFAMLKAFQVPPLVASSGLAMNEPLTQTSNPSRDSTRIEVRGLPTARVLDPIRIR